MAARGGIAVRWVWALDSSSIPHIGGFVALGHSPKPRELGGTVLREGKLAGRLGITKRKRRAHVTFLVLMSSFCLAGCL